jgi:hypothetical protein
MSGMSRRIIRMEETQRLSVEALKAGWVWMSHPAHFIGGMNCRFHLNTCVNEKYIISTVGELLWDEGVREIMAKSRGVLLEGKGDARLADYMKKIGYEEVGFGRKFETMVFTAKRNPSPDSQCCLWVVSDFSDLDMYGCNDAAEANRIHLDMCEKWSLL